MVWGVHLSAKELGIAVKSNATTLPHILHLESFYISSFVLQQSMILLLAVHMYAIWADKMLGNLRCNSPIYNIDKLESITNSWTH